ncbi:aminodeoxychorismate lyase [Porticoccaceae bacterium]|jgi:4-amino-4-deoxychorismate lyase|nr:aminodeoxychorismate lyase [Porticoccaceae bacterium]
MVYHSINGEFVGTSGDAAVGPGDRGLAYGHGLFESICYHSGQLPLKQRHMQRLCADAMVLGIELDSSLINTYLTAFQADLAAAGLDQGVVRVQVTAGSGGRGYQSPPSISPLVICQYAEFDEDQARLHRQQGIKLWRCSYRLPLNPPLAGIKHLNRLDQVMARREWSNTDYADGLMLAADNNVIETTAANLFARTAHGWITPAINNAGVAGVMRMLLSAEIFPALTIPVSVKTLSLSQLEQASEIFVCNSLRGIVPVTQIGESGSDAMVSKLIGEQTKMLQSALAQQYSCYL